MTGFGYNVNGFGAGGVAEQFPTGGHLYDAAGSHTWVCPNGPTTVSVVVIGAGGSNGSAGGALAYKNDIPVTAGASYDVVIAAYGDRTYFSATGVVSAAQSDNKTGDGGGNGGAGNVGGGGAGGYSGAGGRSNGETNSAGTDGAGGAGGGAGGNYYYPSWWAGAGGGGVGVYGEGDNGAGRSGGTGGGGGSGGENGGNVTGSYVAGNGGGYGGAGGQGLGGSGSGHLGAVRIIWGEDTRTFPSTNVGQDYGGIDEGYN